MSTNAELNGITFENWPLEDYLRKQEAKEAKAEAREQMEEDVKLKKQATYHSPDSKKKESKYVGRSRVRVLTRREINVQYREDILMTAPTIMHSVIALLLSGDELSVAKISDILGKSGKYEEKQYQQSSISTRMTAIMKSPLAPWVIRENTGLPKKPSYIYYMRKEAQNLTLDEAYGLYNKRNKQITPEYLAEKYEWFNRAVNVIPKVIEEEQEPARVVSPAPIKESIEKAIGDALGVKVEVSGKVQVVVKFVLIGLREQ